MSPSRFALLFALALQALARVASGQVSGFAVNRFEPSDRGSDWFVSESLDLRGAHRPAFGVVTDWAYKPLVLYDPGNVRSAARANAITDQVTLHAGASLVVAGRFRVGVNVPLVLYQHGDDLSAVAIAARSPEKPAVGDVRLTFDAGVFGTYGDVVRGAVGVQVFLPTGDRGLYTGDGTLRVAPRMLVAGDWMGLIYAAKLGFLVRPLDQAFEGRVLGSEVFFSVAAGLKVRDRFVFGPELYGSTVVLGADSWRVRSTPLELLLGGHLTLGDDWQVGTAIGPGLTRGDGSPSMRVVASLEYAPDVCVDKDGDGICATHDACPEVDGVRTRDPKTNGCPAQPLDIAPAPDRPPVQEPEAPAESPL